MREKAFLYHIAEEICRKANVWKIILFSQKYGLSGGVDSFKLCIIIKNGDKTQVEKNIYLGVETDIPFDVVIYTKKEFEMLSGEKGTFAHKVNTTGKVLYE